MSKLHLTLSQPRHGWLPVRLELAGRVISFPASHGPNNPVKEIYRAIAAALQGEIGTVWWHVEPHGYFFELSQAGRGYQLRLLYAHHSLSSPKKELALVHGTAEDIVQPLLTALQAFGEYDPDPQDWRNTELPALDELEFAMLQADPADR